MNAFTDTARVSPTNVVQVRPSPSVSDENVSTQSSDMAIDLLFRTDYMSLSLPFDCLNYDKVQAESGAGKIKSSRSNRQSRRQTFSCGTNFFKSDHAQKRLHLAVSSGNTDLVEELLLEGVNPCCTDDKLRSPLHLAAASGNEKTVKLLLDFGANPNQKDLIGNTPLHLAACTTKVPVVTLLLQRGTDVNLLDLSGRTPLHCAASRLRFLHENKQFTSFQLKAEVTKIVTMIREYLGRSGQGTIPNELDDLRHQLESTTTQEEIDCVGDLLSRFADLEIKKISMSS